MASCFNFNFILHQIIFIIRVISLLNLISSSSIVLLEVCDIFILLSKMFPILMLKYVDIFEVMVTKCFVILSLDQEKEKWQFLSSYCGTRALGFN